MLHAQAILTAKGVSMVSHRTLLLSVIGSVITCALPAAKAQGLSAQDRMFMENAAKGGMHEVHMGRLGIERGQSEAVKGLCQRLINDHNMAYKDLEALAKQKGVTLPADDAKVVSPAPLATKSGTDFDREFAKLIIEDHQRDIAAFEKEAGSGSDPELRNWASKALPTLRAHLTEAQAIPKAASNLQ
jgi:putative membrane protein